MAGRPEDVSCHTLPALRAATASEFKRQTATPLFFSAIAARYAPNPLAPRWLWHLCTAVRLPTIKNDLISRNL
jgi:hypothetical protein